MESEDRELLVVMRRCFAAKAELAAQLQAERKAAGAPIGMFYDPRQNADRAASNARIKLKAEMVSLDPGRNSHGRARQIEGGRGARRMGVV